MKSHAQYDLLVRAELREQLTQVEPISEYEIDFTVDMCSQIVQSHWSATHRQFEDANPDDHEINEALSDQNFRTAYQVQFIWQVAIWRINALFEAILSQWFPGPQPLQIRQTMRSIEATGIVLPRETKAELHSWLDLRDVFSHHPPEAPTFAHQLERDDVEEFAALIRSVLAIVKPHAKGRDAGA